MGCKGRALLALLVVATVASFPSSSCAQEDEGLFRRRRPGREVEAPIREPGVEGAPAGEGIEPAPEDEIAPAAPYMPPPAFVAVPDRWRIVETLGLRERWWDPYGQNTLKGDKPIFGDDWFLSLRGVSDTLVEARRLPVPRGNQSTGGSGDLDVFGDGDQLIVNQNFLVEAALIQGNTTFKPPDWEFRVTGVGNVSYLDVQELGLVNVDPEDGTERTDGHFAFQELFVDRHIRNVSEYYDFDSIRVGIQPFTTDFRGFLYEDSQPGVRLFGTRASNRFQYNLAWFRRLEKDTNSGLNTVFEPRSDDVFVADAFLQDFPVLGFTSQALVVYNRNDEGDARPHFNKNGFIERPASIGDERPHSYDVGYLGLGGDGHIGRVNLTTNAFLAVGRDDHNPIAQRATDILAYLVAAEGSMDFDWYRLKLFGYHSSGDDDPLDGDANGFDAIFEDPNFAGADTSFFQRQPIPLIGGGGVVLSGRNALLPALRSSKEEGQSNFVNPGLLLLGAGGDFDLMPSLRLTFDVSWLDLVDTSVLRLVRQQAEVDNNFGYDLSAALLWRPLFIENIVLRLSGAVLVPGPGFDDLYEDRYSALYSVLFNAVLTY